MTTPLDRRQFFDRLSSKREEAMHRHSTYYRDRVRWLQKIIPADTSIIDIGCGIGSILAALPHEKKTGLDFSSGMISCAQKNHPNIRFLLDDVEHLAHAEVYDYVLLLDAVNYIRDVQESFRNIREKLTSPSSRLVITYFNFLWAPLFWFVETCGLRTKFPARNWLSYADIENMLTLEGYEVIERGGRVLLPIGIPLLTFLCNRILSTLPILRRLCLVQTIIARPIPSSHRACSVSVISAVRNERGNIRPILNNMPRIGLSTELVFVEGHSTDGTWEEMESAAREYTGPVQIKKYQQTGKGKGDALHLGIREATSDIIIIYDGDFTVHPQELVKLYEALASGHAEFVNGSRLVYPFEESAMPLLNLIGNRIFSLLFSWLFSQHIVDVLSPVKAFYRSSYHGMTTRMDPFGDFDLFLGAASQHCRIRETPLRYLERTYGTTKLKPFSHGTTLLKLWWHGARLLK